MMEFQSVHEKWSQYGEMTTEMADVVERDLDNFLETEFSQIEQCLQKDDLETAFSRTVAMTQLVSAAANRAPRVIRKFKKWLKRLHATLHMIAQKWNAETFTISTGFPSGVTIELTWKV